MGKNAKPYLDAVNEIENRLNILLAFGAGDLSEIAITRRMLYHMKKEFKENLPLVLSSGDFRDPKSGLIGPELWEYQWRVVVHDLLFPSRAKDPAIKKAYWDKHYEYLRFAAEKRAEARTADPIRVEDNVAGIVYLARPNVDLHERIMPLVMDEFMRWFDLKASDVFYALSVKTAYYYFLTERRDMAALIRLISQAAMDAVAYADPSIKIKPKVEQEILGMMIGFIPIVGNAVAAYEVFTGKDIFGNPLDPLSRSILASSVIFPVAGRFFSGGGRIAYSETRLVRLYGHQADEWERVLATAGRIDDDTMRAISRAEEALRLEGKIEPALAKKAAAALPDVAQPRGLLQSSIDKRVDEAFDELRKANDIFKTLDNHAIRRVLEKGPNIDHIKGQLLEELVESRFVPWLAKRGGLEALGIRFFDKNRLPIDVTGKSVEFIPGHLIRDGQGRQITDGVIGVWHEGEFIIGAIFECKAGKSAARELSFKSVSYSQLSAPQRNELRAFANDRYKSQLSIAQRKGEKYTKKVEDVEKEILKETRLSERGGQVRRDIERLSGTEREVIDISTKGPGSVREMDLPTSLWIGDMPAPVAVRISPTRTKFFLLTPNDITSRATIEKQLKELGVSFELIGVNLSSNDLKQVAEKLSVIAKALDPQAL